MLRWSAQDDFLQVSGLPATYLFPVGTRWAEGSVTVIFRPRPGFLSRVEEGNASSNSVRLWAVTGTGNGMGPTWIRRERQMVGVQPTKTTNSSKIGKCNLFSMRTVVYIILCGRPRIMSVRLYDYHFLKGISNFKNNLMHYETCYIMLCYET